MCLQPCQWLQHVSCDVLLFDDHDCSMLLLLLFARVSNVDLCAGCRVRPKCWRTNLSFLGVLMLVRRSSGLILILVFCSLVCLLHDGRFHGCNIEAWSGSLGTAPNVDESLVKERSGGFLFVLCLQC